MSTDALAISLNTASLNSYIRTVNRYPMLSVEEERRLALKFRKDGDIEAARWMVLTHLRMVVSIARGYLGYGLPMEDLVQEGNLGLMLAVRRFDPGKGVRLSAFAMHWIRAQINEYILRNWRMVKMATTKAQRKLFYNLRRMKQGLGPLNGEEAAEIASELDVAQGDVQEMDMRFSGGDSSFDAWGDEDAHPVPAGYLEDLRYEPSQSVEDEDSRAQESAGLHAALVRLDARSRDIVSRRWLVDDKVTLQELASEYGLSAERVRQIEAAAFSKIRALLKH